MNLRYFFAGKHDKKSVLKVGTLKKYLIIVSIVHQREIIMAKMAISNFDNFFAF